MQRPSPGHDQPIVWNGEAARAFVPAPLPPTPPLDLGLLAVPLEQATRALTRLDAMSDDLPALDLCLYGYVRKEAVLSSQIEGTQSSLSDLLLFELDEAPGVPLDDVVGVSRYVAALHRGIQALDEGTLPLCNRLLRMLHGILLEEGRGADKMPGEFRRDQVWIGGSFDSLAQATFVPTPPDHVEQCMADLERFLNHPPGDLPLLCRAGLAHVQFETIHPFLDGNGRLGRMLITLMLHAEGALNHPLLYLSLFFKEHRSTYYELLNRVRTHGDWERWMLFFLEGVETVSLEAVATAKRIRDLETKDAGRIRARLGRAARTALAVHEVFLERPVATAAYVARRARVAPATALRRLGDLEELGIVREVTGRKRGRVFVYAECLRLLEEGTRITPQP